MKLKHITLIAITGLVFVAACKPAADNTTLAQLNEKKADFETRIAQLEDSLEIIEDRIIEVDSTKDHNYPIVAIDSVRNSEFSEDVIFQGNVTADRTIMLGPETSGLVKAINVREGQYISKGKTIATLDSEILRQNIKEVQKTLELSEYMLQKQQNLKDQGIGAEATFIQSKNQVESLRTKLATLNTQVSKSRVVAPFSGYVEEIFTKLGEMASPSMPMVRLVNLEKMVVKAEVSEGYLMDIMVGDKVTLNFPSIGKVIDDAKITSVGKYINPTNRTFPIQVSINNKDKQIIPNLIAEVSVEKDFTKEAIIVPSSSVLTDSEGNKYAYVLVDGMSSKRKVDVIHVKEKYTQISSSSEVKIGDLIITKGANSVSEGQKVTELKK